MTVNRSAKDGIKGLHICEVFRVSMQQEKGRTVPGCEVVQLDALDLGIADGDRFGGPGACRHGGAKQQRSGDAPQARRQRRRDETPCWLSG
jgi:hypothetical protein